MRDCTTIIIMGLLVIGLSAGCATPVLGPGQAVIDGFKVNVKQWEKWKAQVGQRASFELDCPQEDLSMTILDTTSDMPTTVGVSGCGYRAVFISANGKWVMNSVNQPASDAQAVAE
jgi:hypothetical protein